jgi:hypothetical protein
VTSCKPVPLARDLRFEDYPYLVSALDHLRLDANRSKTEVGFSPLRLAICFLHWHDLKQAKEERITSPLLLLPVTLEKKKGVRDAIVLTAETDQAEVNPVLRQYLFQLYGMRLPDYIDVSDPKAIDALSAELLKQIQASEPAVSLTRVDKPRIDLVLAQAKRRLEAYRKRVSLSGRLARSHRGFDYSYARSKLHPLGVQMFSHLVYPAAAPNRELHDAPRPRIFQHSPDASDDTKKTVEKQQYHLKDGGTSGGPYEWALDLCSVTLASFHYRKMSLVRDYAGMLEDSGTHPVFDALFSTEDGRRKAPERDLLAREASRRRGVVDPLDGDHERLQRRRGVPAQLPPLRGGDVDRRSRGGTGRARELLPARRGAGQRDGRDGLGAFDRGASCEGIA